ncbi:hypothetical protein HYDPIDRAFT_26350 [Hydnomerulius pinastri MD-312]|nr:hypothetical protein HYDPIDRAFT_26350 [Hydnomerulius pinastri MD-312]
MSPGLTNPVNPAATTPKEPVTDPSTTAKEQVTDPSTKPKEPATEPSTKPEETTTEPSTKPEETTTKPSTKPEDDDQEDSGEDVDDKPTLNTVEELAKGNIQTAKGKKEFTILIVGKFYRETGTGKTTVLSLLANILKGNSPDSYEKFNEASNEEGGSAKHSQTNKAYLYTFESKNGVKYNILDTPGLADTRGIAQDEQHKASIAKAIKDSITTVDAVLILANGTVPRLGVATDYALSTLSSMFPITLAKNIGFLFTNVSSPLSWNFDEESLPDVLRDNQLYLLDNPVAMQDKYTKEKEKMEKKGKVNQRILKTLKASVEEGHKKALGELVKIFDWMDGLSPQPTKDILSLYNQSQDIERKISDVLSTMEQMATKKQALKKIETESDGTNLTIEQYKKYQSTIKQQVYKQIDTPKHNTLCAVPKCYNNCHEQCQLDFSFDPKGLLNCWAFSGSKGLQGCRKCDHSYEHHHHYNVRWELREDTQITIDKEAKKKHDEAVSEKAQQELGMAQLKKTIASMDTALEEATAKVGQLVDEYAKLSLSGSFAGQVKKSVALLELNLETMRGNGTDEQTIKAVEKALARMKEKLALVEKAKQEARKNRSIGRKIIDAITGN